MEDNTIYYGILMTKIEIYKGIYFYKPLHIIEGNYIEEDDNVYFVDFMGTEYLTISDFEMAFGDNEIGIGYIITKEQLLEHMGNVPIEEAKAAYYNSIYEKVHIGFFDSDVSKIKILQMDFMKLAEQMDGLDTNSHISGIEMLFGNQKQSLSQDSEDCDFEDVIAIEFDELKRLLDLKDSNQIKIELQKIYDSLEQSRPIVLEQMNKVQKCNDITGDYVRRLFYDCKETLTLIENMEEMKDTINKMIEMYVKLIDVIDQRKKLGFSVEEINTFLYDHVNKYKQLLKLDNLNSIKMAVQEIMNEEAKTIQKLVDMIDSINLSSIELRKSENNSNNQKKSVEKWLQELNDLVGLDKIKEQVNELMKYLVYLEKVKDHVILENVNLNMFYAGNPGTGKTTVARIISKILYDLGYIKNDKVGEFTTKDIIGEYVGQTGPKVARVMKEYRGGVIFIDEAYGFGSQGQSFAQEALLEILKEMEKKETVFIFAGYEKEMKAVLEMNPGLKSRIGYIFNFNDYSLDELVQILQTKVRKAKLKIDEEAIKLLIPIIEQAKNMKHFGNGRFIDNVFYRLLFNHAKNTEDIEDLDILMTITKEDIKENMLEKLGINDSEKNIGFQMTKKKEG